MQVVSQADAAPERYEAYRNRLTELQDRLLGEIYDRKLRGEYVDDLARESLDIGRRLARLKS